MMVSCEDQWQREAKIDHVYFRNNVKPRSISINLGTPTCRLHVNKFPNTYTHAFYIVCETESKKPAA